MPERPPPTPYPIPPSPNSQPPPPPRRSAVRPTIFLGATTSINVLPGDDVSVTYRSIGPEGSSDKTATFYVQASLSHRLYSLISLRKLPPTRHRQLVVYCYQLINIDFTVLWVETVVSCVGRVGRVGQVRVGWVSVGGVGRKLL